MKLLKPQTADAASAGQNILESSRKTDNEILHSGSGKQLRRANCGFTARARAELLPAGPNGDRIEAAGR